nr:hypothetical protein [Tanacetum cinerariifolium]
MSKVLQERGSKSLHSSTKTNLRDHVNSIPTTVETNTTPIRHIGSTHYVVSDQHNSKLIFKPRKETIPLPSHLYDDCYKEKGSYRLKDLDAYSIKTTLRNDALPEKEKDPGSFTLPCYIINVCFEKAFADLGASVSIMPLSTYLYLGLGKLAHTRLTIELADKTVKHPKENAKNVLVGISKFVFPVDFIIVDIPEDVNVPLILRRPILSTTQAKSLEEIQLRIWNPPLRKVRRIHIDCAYNLKFSCIIGFEYVHANFLPIFPINVMSKKSYNSVVKDKIKFKRRNELGNFINVPVLIGNFYVVTDFTVVEDMDPYLDEEIGDVIGGEPFCKASCVEAKCFDGINTISDFDDSVTYQMVRSNLRFKHLTNVNYKKILLLLK